MKGAQKLRTNLMKLGLICCIFLWMATLYARGKLPLGQTFRHEGILGTTFTGCLVEETRVGNYRAVVPTITGSAWITGISQYVLDAEDPFPEGFTVGDLWAGGKG